MTNPIHVKAMKMIGGRKCEEDFNVKISSVTEEQANEEEKRESSSQS